MLHCYECHCCDTRLNLGNVPFPQIALRLSQPWDIEPRCTLNLQRFPVGSQFLQTTTAIEFRCGKPSSCNGSIYSYLIKGPFEFGRVQECFKEIKTGHFMTTIPYAKNTSCYNWQNGPYRRTIFWDKQIETRIGRSPLELKLPSPQKKANYYTVTQLKNSVRHHHWGKKRKYNIFVEDCSCYRSFVCYIF